MIALLVLFACLPVASAIELSGQYRNLLFETRDSLKQYSHMSLNRLRLEVDAEQGPLRLHLAYDHELLGGGLVSDPLVAAALRQPEPTWLDASAVIVQRSDLNWQHKFYRGWLEYDAGALDLKLGRQRIAWGSGRIWNPTDRFNPVQPTALEPEQKLGVDAARMEWHYAGNGSLVLVGAPARAAYRTSRKLALRWQDTIGVFDVAAMVGRIQSENMFGVDITGNLGDAGVRLEWMQARNARDGTYGQLVAGIDYTWIQRWFPRGLYMALEYFYNGAASTVPQTADRLNSRSRQQLGGMLAYDLTPLWRAELLWIADLQQYSWFAAPSLTWSASDQLDVQCFVQLAQGGGTSEFARLQPLFGMRIDYYF